MVFRLAALRKERGLTQTAVAEVLGISRHRYSGFELEPARMPARFLAALADYYGTSADYLAGLTDNPAPYPQPEAK